MPEVDAAASSSNIRTLEDYQESQRKAKSKLGQDEFLKILTAQLANQDPLEPSSNGEFIAQMAQFSALEAMSEMSTGFMASQAYSMIGKYVALQDGTSGKVIGVASEDGVNYLMIGDKYVDAKNVVGVMDPSAVEGDLDDQILQSANLIGKTITAQIPSEDGKTTTPITGVVEKLTIKDGAVYAVVDGTDVPISSITEISNQEEN